mmetsp:Transcript_33283/g.88044  ORF Transcript_33283/g.88044 Transcript_33283/m.88044 type:complete len:206 (-) Transcript_33283:330-947(-)
MGHSVQRAQSTSPPPRSLVYGRLGPPSSRARSCVQWPVVRVPPARLWLHITRVPRAPRARKPPVVEPWDAHAPQTPNRNTPITRSHPHHPHLVLLLAEVLIVIQRLRLAREEMAQEVVQRAARRQQVLVAVAAATFGRVKELVERGVEHTESLILDGHHGRAVGAVEVEQQVVERLAANRGHRQVAQPSATHHRHQLIATLEVLV